MKKLIWVIDDDPGLLENIQLLFAVEKLQGEFISQPVSVEELFKNKPRPALILLDIFMDGINGVEMCQQIKSNPATAQIPVILMSADRHLDQKAQQAGADDSIQKPFDGEEILELIHYYID